MRRMFWAFFREQGHLRNEELYPGAAPPTPRCSIPGMQCPPYIPEGAIAPHECDTLPKCIRTVHDNANPPVAAFTVIFDACGPFLAHKLRPRALQGLGFFKEFVGTCNTLLSVLRCNISMKERAFNIWNQKKYGVSAETHSATAQRDNTEAHGRCGSLVRILRRGEKSALVSGRSMCEWT